jgi:hypothetical protein
MLNNTLYFKNGSRAKIDIEDFARGKCLHDDAEIILYVRLRAAGHAAFDSFVSAFTHLGGHPDDLAAAATSFERSLVFSRAFEEAVENGDVAVLRAEWQHAVHTARGRTSAARAALERAAVAKSEAAVPHIVNDPALAEEREKERRVSHHKMMEEAINTDAGFTFLK